MAIVRMTAVDPADVSALRSGGAAAGNCGDSGCCACVPDAMSRICRVEVSDVWVATLKPPNLGPIVNASVTGSARRTVPISPCAAPANCAPGLTRSIASASNFISNWSPSCTIVLAALGVASTVRRPVAPVEPCPELVEAS